MKLIKLAFISVLMLFVIASLVGALLPSTVLVSRAININTKADSIKPQLVSISNWSYWMEGMNNAAVNISSPSHATIGNTDVTITAVTDSTVTSFWKPAKGNKQTSTMRVIANGTGNVTVVQWQFEEKLSWYPWARLGSMMNDKILGTMMEKNLNNLKTVLEKQ